MSPSPVEFAARRGRNTLLLMGALLFVGAGVWLVLQPGSDARTRWIGAGNALFFGLCAWAFVREDLRPRARLRLDAWGIELRHPRAKSSFRHAWREVASVAVREEERGATVVLALRASTSPPEETVPDFMAARGFSSAMLGAGTLLSPAELGTDAPILAAEIERFRRLYADAPPPVRREDMM